MDKIKVSIVLYAHHPHKINILDISLHEEILHGVSTARISQKGVPRDPQHKPVLSHTAFVYRKDGSYEFLFLL